MPEYKVVQTEDGDLWVEFLGFAVHINPTDEGIVVDVWPQEDGVSVEPLATTYAFFAEREAS